MNTEQINEIIENYNQLVELASKKAKFISHLDKEHYKISIGISEVSFENGNVFISCEGNWKNDYSAFTFPIKWLIVTDDELQVIVLEAKKVREDKIILLENEKKNKLVEEAKQREFENYKKLKEKFG